MSLYFHCIGFNNYFLDADEYHKLFFNNLDTPIIKCEIVNSHYLAYKISQSFLVRDNNTRNHHFCKSHIIRCQNYILIINKEV